jgi:hypothetical protein
MISQIDPEENEMAKRTLIIIAAAPLLGCASLHPPAPVPYEELPEFNQIVLDVCEEYPTDGTHGYFWPRGEGPYYDGCTSDIYFLGEKVMSGEPGGQTYCCGFTAEVFVEAYSRWLERHGEEHTRITPDTFRRFLRLWFVLERNGPGPSAALEEYDLGFEIPNNEWEESVLPGDFCAMWRTEQDSGKISGHSIIFLRWIYAWDGEIGGIEYFSSQPSTDGIGRRREYFGSNGGMSRHYTWFGRVEPERAL